MGGPPRAPRLRPPCRGVSLLVPQSPALGGTLGGGAVGREQLETCAIHVYVTRFPQGASHPLLPAQADLPGAVGTGDTRQGRCPQKVPGGSSEEAGREGRGRARATCHYQASPPLLPHVKMGLVPVPQGCGVSVESVAGAEALAL